MSAREVIANYWLGEGGECLEDAYPRHRQVAYDRADEILSALAAAGYKIVSREPTHEMIKAASESRAEDDERQFPALCDLLDFSGENKTRTVIRAALTAAIDAANPTEGK